MKREIKQRMGNDSIGVGFLPFMYIRDTIFEQRPEELERVTIPGRGNRMCKDSEVLEIGR